MWNIFQFGNEGVPRAHYAKSNPKQMNINWKTIMNRTSKYANDRNIEWLFYLLKPDATKTCHLGNDCTSVIKSYTGFIDVSLSIAKKPLPRARDFELDVTIAAWNTVFVGLLLGYTLLCYLKTFHEKFCGGISYYHVPQFKGCSWKVICFSFYETYQHN